MSDDDINLQKEIDELCDGLHPVVCFSVTSMMAGRKFMEKVSNDLGVTILDLTPFDLVEALKKDLP